MTSTLLARGRGGSPNPESGVEASAARRVQRRRTLPSGRALVGGLLVATSFIGLYAAHGASTAAPETSWLIAVRPIPAGHVIVADDLALAAVRLTDSSEARGLSDPGDVIGHTAVIALDDGDLIQRGAISGAAASATRPAARRVALHLDRDQALNGEVAPGDEVDVLVTPPSSATAGSSTRVIVHRALVQSTATGDDSSVGSTGKVLMTLVVDDESAAIAVVDAYSTGRVHLIASSPLEPADGGAGDR